MFFLSSICESSAILKVIKFIMELLNIVFILVPIGLILIVTIDLSRAVIASDESAMDKTKKIILKRIIMAVILFLVPNIVRLSLSLIDDSSTLIFNNYDSCMENIKDIDKYEKIEEIKEEKIREEKEKLKEKAVKALEKALKESVATSYKNRGSADNNSSDGNFDGTTAGKSYTLSDSGWRKLTIVCKQEQGSSEKGIKAEASLIANKYDFASKKKFKNIYEYVKNSEWWNEKSFEDTNVSKREISYVKSVVEKGNRIFPLYINEHDCIKCGRDNKGNDIWGIVKLEVNGKTYTSANDRLNKNNYIKDKTLIYNKGNSRYVFYEFPAKGTDPFGYTKEYYKKITGKEYK